MTTTLNLAQYQGTLAKIAKINARAAKQGLSGHLAVESTKPYARRVCDHAPQADCAALGDWGHHFEKVVDVEITGDAPKHDGWTFAARVDRAGESYTLATAPGIDHVSREGIVLGQCSHCNTNRARKTTYILLSDQGDRIQVGSTCIKDFLGWEGTVAWLDVPEVNDEWLGGGFYVDPKYKVQSVLRVAIASIRDRGFVSTSSYSQQPTRDHVSLVFSTGRLSERDAEERDRLTALASSVSDEDVQALVDFLLSDDFNGSSSYVENLKVIAAQEYIGSRQFGLIVSAPQAYAKHLGLVAERAVKKASEWLGSVGEKVTTTITITRIVNVGSYSYGGPDSYLILGLTEAGAVVKTFTTAAWSRDVEVGDEVTLTATVKAHETYQDTKQTSLTRSKVVA